MDMPSVKGEKGYSYDEKIALEISLVKLAVSAEPTKSGKKSSSRRI